MAATLPPGPPLPTLVQTAAVLWRPHRFLAACHRRYGDRFTIRFGPLGTVVYLVDPADIKAVLRGDPETFHAGESNATVLAPVLGSSSVLVLDEAAHLRRRRLMLPPFHRDAVRRQTELMAQIAAAEVESWPVGRPFPLHSRMRAIALEVILRTVIGARDEQRLAALRRVLPGLADLGVIRVLQLMYPGLRDPWLWGRFQRVKDRADALLHAEIAGCRADPGLAERTDVLAMLVRARDEDGQPMPADELRDQLVTLLLAGHETTATGLAWTFERLVRHPAVLARAAEAARDGADQHRGDGYLDAVVAEGLRVRPVVPEISRRLTRPITLAGYRLPAGVCVEPAINLVQRSARHYPRPEDFDPDRFDGARPDPAVWLPFGGGARRCLGATFATVEMRTVLREVLRRVDLLPTDAPGERPRLRNVTLVPHAGARIAVRSRRAAAAVG